MKLRILGLSLAVLIATIPLTSISSAAVKAGAKCKVVGQTKIKKQKEFTCVKKGSKFVWSKGKIVITSKKVSKTPAPVESAAPVESESVKPVSPGAFCAPAGATGKSAKGVDYTCKTSDTDSRNRWRQ